MNKHVPNIITSLRIVLIPVFAFLYLSDIFWPSVAVLAVIMLSDLVDGFIARKYHLESRVGEILDPIADKMCLITICVCLIIKRLIPIWFIIIYLAKELTMIVVGGIGILFMKKQKAIAKARWYGKVGTFSLYTAMLSVFLFPEFMLSHPVLWNGVFAFVLFWEIYSFIGYGLDFIRGARKKGDDISIFEDEPDTQVTQDNESGE